MGLRCKSSIDTAQLERNKVGEDRCIGNKGIAATAFPCVHRVAKPRCGSGFQVCKMTDRIDDCTLKSAWQMTLGAMEVSRNVTWQAEILLCLMLG